MTCYAGAYAKFLTVRELIKIKKSNTEFYDIISDNPAKKLTRLQGWHPM